MSRVRGAVCVQAARFGEWIADVKGSCLRTVNLISVKVAALWPTRVPRPLYCLPVSHEYRASVALGLVLDCSVTPLSLWMIVFADWVLPASVRFVIVVLCLDGALFTREGF